MGAPNASEPTDSLVNQNHGGRALITWAKTASLPEEVAGHGQGHLRGNRGDTLEKREGETWETLPRQPSLFEWMAKSESYKAEPKKTSGGEGVGAAHSSEENRDSITRSSEGTAVQQKPALQGGVSDCSADGGTTNGRTKTQELQRRLYLKSKRERRCRYYSLFDKVYDRDILMEAWQLVRRNKGAAGTDGQGIKEIEEDIGVEKCLTDIQTELRTGQYRPRAIRRVYIPKPNGEKRPLGIPTVKDRVIQMATKIVIEPIFGSSRNVVQ